jgi:hypothetical protein
MKLNKLKWNLEMKHSKLKKKPEEYFRINSHPAKEVLPMAVLVSYQMTRGKTQNKKTHVILNYETP